MNIRQVQQGIEESLASLATSTLSPALEGLRQLPVSDRNPQVSIRYLGNGRKVREDASASYFDPDRCEVVIRFVPFESSRGDRDLDESDAPNAEAEASAFDFESVFDQLVDALKSVEDTRQFVGLKWFRDQILPQSGHNWARDPVVRGSVLRHATDQRLVLTSHVPNPVHPHHPVTAIRINRRHARFRPDAPKRDTGFAPVRIRGGSISDTVLGDRR